jgi:hypothetical protein
MYLGAGTFEAIRLAAKSKNVFYFPLILAAFVQTHVWYGSGTLWGFLSAPLKFRKSNFRSNVENAGR